MAACHSTRRRSNAILETSCRTSRLPALPKRCGNWCRNGPAIIHVWIRGPVSIAPPCWTVNWLTRRTFTSVLGGPWPPSLSEGALQRGTIPSAEVRSRFIGALEEFHECAFGVGRRTHRVVRKDEFAQLLGKEGLSRAHCGAGKAVRCRICVRIERCIGYRPGAARPKARA